MKIYTQKTALKRTIEQHKLASKQLGFVPTMGALHQGHLSLVEEALQNNDIVVVSIFVNPTQFNNADDLQNYPRNLNQDISLLTTVSENILVYAPTLADIYPKGTEAQIFDFGGLEHVMEGQFRAGHFNGVGTVVKRLFDIVKPDHAYFGQKDYQQLLIIKKLVSLFKMDVIIHGCEIYRDKDGLAMSSRNKRLSKAHRKVAPFIYKTLKTAKTKFKTKSAKFVTDWANKQFKKEPLLELEYFVIAEASTLKPINRKQQNKTYRAFVAVYAGDVRLIDNIALN